MKNESKTQTESTLVHTHSDWRSNSYPWIQKQQCQQHKRNETNNINASLSTMALIRNWTSLTSDMIKFGIRIFVVFWQIHSITQTHWLCWTSTDFIKTTVRSMKLVEPIGRNELHIWNISGCTPLMCVHAHGMKMLDVCILLVCPKLSPSSLSLLPRRVPGVTCSTETINMRLTFRPIWVETGFPPNKHNIGSFRGFSPPCHCDKYVDVVPSRLEVGVLFTIYGWTMGRLNSTQGT